jgi:HEAT repeat protein
MHDVGAIDTLATALSSREDRLVGDAAWALGEILATHPKDSRIPALVDRLAHLGKNGGWAAAVNSTAALGRLLWATPIQDRANVLGKDRRKQLINLVFHKSRLVRINTAHALGSLPPDDDLIRPLAQLLHDDISAHVRVAAAHALARLDSPKSQAALKQAENDGDSDVRAAAKAGSSTPVARTEWRTFYVVDPSADDAAVRQEQYFVHTRDGVVWASYTDARGELNSEHVPTGEAVVWPASRESEY